MIQHEIRNRRFLPIIPVIGYALSLTTSSFLLEKGIEEIDSTLLETNKTKTVRNIVYDRCRLYGFGSFNRHPIFSRRVLCIDSELRVKSLICKVGRWP